MKRRSDMLLAALGALLLLTGCSLARPQAAKEDDRFLGFYLVREDRIGGGFFDNPHLTEYGTSSVSLDGHGAFRVPDEVLFAEKADQDWVFPGLEGLRLFTYRGVYEDGSSYLGVASDLSPGEEGNQLKVTDQGNTDIISGVLYLGPPLGQEDWDPYEDKHIWTAYRVYQAPDGRPYLDGSGSSFTSTPGSYQESRSYAATENGETRREDTLEVTISIEAVPRLEGLRAVQFSADNRVLAVQELSLEEDLPAVGCGPETAWVLVEEHSRDGVRRTAYAVPSPGEADAVHTLVLLDSRGMGRQAELVIRAQGDPTPA